MIYNIVKTNEEFFYITKCKIDIDHVIDIEYIKSKNLLHLLYKINCKKIKNLDLFKDSIFRYIKAKRNIVYWFNKNKHEYDLWRLAKYNAYRDYTKSVKSKKLNKFICYENFWENTQEEKLNIQSFEAVQFIINDFKNAYYLITNNFEVIKI